MTESDEARRVCAETASRLRRALRWDVVLLLIATAALAQGWPWPGAAPRALAGLLAVSSALLFWYDLRLYFDADIFATWAQVDDLDAAMRDFDQQLRRWRHAPLPARDLAQRVAGALRLHARHRRWRALQVLLLLATLAFAAFD